MAHERRDSRWTILVGYEGSARSDDALALAQDLFAALGGRLVVGCVYRYRTLGGRFASGEAAGAVAEAGCRRVRRVVAERVVAPATSPAEGLSYLAGAEHADLVVVGSARRALRGRLLRGSSADGLLRRGVCSVAIAPSGYRRRQGRLRSVGAVFDGAPSSRAAVRIAAAIAVASGGGVRIYATAGALPRDGIRGVLAPLLGAATLEAVVPVGAVARESRAVLDLVVASPSEGFRLPGLAPGRHRRRLRACHCPVLILRLEPGEASGARAVAGQEVLSS